MGSRKIANILDKTASGSHCMSLVEMLTAFDTVEESCLSLVSSKKLKTEVRRRVAEWKLKLCCDRDAAIEDVDALYQTASALGYSNIENEATIGVYFSQYCLRQSQFSRAKFVLTELRAKLSKESKKNDLEVYRYYISLCGKLLDTISKLDV